MSGNLQLVRPNPYDIDEVAVHPAGAERGSVILCHNQTAIWVNRLLNVENDDAAIRQISQLAVKLMDLEYLNVTSHDVLPTVMEARRQMRTLLRAEKLVTLPSGEDDSETANAEIDIRLAAFGTMIDTIKESAFTRMQTINEISDELEILGVTRVELGNQARATNDTDKELHRKRAKLALQVHHAHLEWVSGITADVVSEKTGFPIQWIIQVYPPSERELDEMLNAAA